MEGQRKRERVQSQRVEPRRHGNRTNLRSAPGIQPKGHLVCTTSGTNVCDSDSTGLEDLKHRASEITSERRIRPLVEE